MTAKGSALVVAILLIALAGVLTTTLTELGRLALRRARLDRDGVRAWFVAEAGLADTAATLPAGHALHRRRSGRAARAARARGRPLDLRASGSSTTATSTRTMPRQMSTHVSSCA